MARRALPAFLTREQRAFLARGRRRWGPHLAKVRSFLGEGLASARGPAVVLGAGSGLEVPWELAPPGTVGWDADPWSRVRTFLRHRTWRPWVFQDLTGGLDELWAAALRSARQPWSGHIRSGRSAALRLAGLVKSMEPGAGPLAAWIESRHPGTIVCANVMGQFGVVARALVDRAFGGRAPWIDEEGAEDPLEEALQGWTARAVAAFLAALERSGADLWLVHDRGVVFGGVPVTLGPLREPWTAQLMADAPLEADDPLCGIDVLEAFRGRKMERHERWLWEVGPGQAHVMESLRVMVAL